jgi:hypothetical protein
MTQVDMAAYIALWKPAWDWILHVYAQGATRENTLETLRDYASLRPAAQAAGDGGGARPSIPGGAVLLECILANLPPPHLSSVAVLN